LRILKVEEDLSLGNIIHKSVEDIHLKNPGSSLGYSDRLPHLPMSVSALNNSVLRLVDTNAGVPDFKAGYDAWKHDNGGAFSVPVREAIELAEQVVNK
jgi:hypothetical protein